MNGDTLAQFFNKVHFSNFKSDRKICSQVVYVTLFLPAVIRANFNWIIYLIHQSNLKNSLNKMCSDFLNKAHFSDFQFNQKNLLTIQL